MGSIKFRELKSRQVLWASVALYVGACALPCLATDTEPFWVVGWEALVWGWTALFMGQYAWLANPLTPVAWALAAVARGRAAALACTLPLVFSLHVFAWVGRLVPRDEGGVNHYKVLALGPGAYCWLASLVLAAASAWLRASLPAPPPAPPVRIEGYPPVG